MKIKDGELFNQQGDNLVVAGKLSDAIIQYSKAIDAVDFNPIYWINRAKVQLQMGDKIEKGLCDLRAAVIASGGCDQMDILAYTELWEYNVKIGNLDDAIFDIQKLLTL